MPHAHRGPPSAASQLRQGDTVDAEAIARELLAHPDLHCAFKAAATTRPDPAREALAVLVRTRRQVVDHHRRLLNEAEALLGELPAPLAERLPGGSKTEPRLAAAARLRLIGDRPTDLRLRLLRRQHRTERALAAERDGLERVGCSYRDRRERPDRLAWDQSFPGVPMLPSLRYAVVRLLLDLALLRCRSDAARDLELLVLRQEVRVLRRRTKRIAWRPGDRLVLTALSRCLPRAGWHAFLVRPETLLRWHRELVRRKWAVFGRRCRPRVATWSCGWQGRTPAGAISGFVANCSSSGTMSLPPRSAPCCGGTASRRLRDRGLLARLPPRSRPRRARL